jgi:hypothetical protein
MANPVLTEHGADALSALIAGLGRHSVVIEVGRVGWQVTTLIARSIRDSGKKMSFVSISDDIDPELHIRLRDEGLDDYVKLIADDPENACDEFGRESVDAAFIHSSTQNVMIRNIWSWSEKMRLNALLVGNWDERSRLAVTKETRGAFTRVGFDQSIWKIPLYNK